MKSNNKEEIDQISEGTESIQDYEEMQPSIGTITPTNNQKANVDINNINNINNNNMNIDTYSDNHNDQNVNAIADPKLGVSEKRTDRVKNFALHGMPTKDVTTFKSHWLRLK